MKNTTSTEVENRANKAADAGRSKWASIANDAIENARLIISEAEASTEPEAKPEHPTEKEPV